MDTDTETAPAVTLDPRVKAPLRDTLLELVYQPVQYNAERRLKAIIEANTETTGATEMSFLYKGRHFAIGDLTLERSKRVRNPLHKNHQPDMDAWLAQEAEVNAERPFVAGCITAALNASNCPADWLKLLPENLHYPILPLVAAYPVPEKLDAGRVLAFKEKHGHLLDAMLTRMVTNLIL